MFWGILQIVMAILQFIGLFMCDCREKKRKSVKDIMLEYGMDEEHAILEWLYAHEFTIKCFKSGMINDLEYEWLLHQIENYGSPDLEG